MFDSITENLPEIKFDFLPSKEEAKNGAISAAKAVSIMGGAALGVYTLERMKVPGAPENAVLGAISSATEPLGDTGRMALGAATGAGGGALTATQLDRLRTATPAELELEELEKSNEEMALEIARNTGMDDPENVSLEEALDNVYDSLVAEHRLRKQLEDQAEDSEVRTTNLETEQAVALIEVADTAEEIYNLVTGETRNEVLNRADVVAQDRAEREEQEATTA